MGKILSSHQPTLPDDPMFQEATLIMGDSKFISSMRRSKETTAGEPKTPTTSQPKAEDKSRVGCSEDGLDLQSVKAEAARRDLRKKAKTDTLRRELGRLNLDGELGDPDTAALISADGKVAIGDFHDEIKDQMGFGDDDWDWKERFLGGGGVRVRTECGKGCIEFGHDSPTTYQRVREIIDALPGDEFVLDYGNKHATGDRDTMLASVNDWEKSRGKRLDFRHRLRPRETGILKEQ